MKQPTFVSIYKRVLGMLAIATSLVFANTASAENCYIMVHGHGTQGNYKNGTDQPALDYWRSSHFDRYAGTDFFAHLLGPNDNYAIVGYDSTDASGYPYWRNETAGEIARQMVSIKQGNEVATFMNRQAHNATLAMTSG